MSEVGQVLRRRREELGLSLDDIQEKTKVRKRYIQAIEEGDWSILPGEVYARGFIRSYADVVGLDGYGLLKQLDEERQRQEQAENLSSEMSTSVKEPPKQPAGMPKPESASPETRKSADSSIPPRSAAREPQKSRGKPVRPGSVASTKKRGAGIGGRVGQTVSVIVILGVLAGGWWALAHRSGSPNNTVAGSAGNQVNETNNSANNTNSTGNETTNNNAVNNTANATATPPSSQVTVKTNTFSNGTQTYVVTTGNPLKVKMTVTQPCWLEIVKQDSTSGDPAGITIQPNQSRTWTVQQKLTLRLGHYPNVTLSVNGQTVALPKINSPFNVTFVKSQS